MLFSLILNVVYLAIFNFIDPEIVLPIYNEKVKYIWYTILYQIPFMSWIGYFSVAYYCGKNMDVFLSFLEKNIKFIWLACVCTAILVMTLAYTGILTPIQSKRVDIIFYTISLTFLFFYIASRMQNIPSFLIEVSKYSFGIYLLHPFFQLLVERAYPNQFSNYNLIIYIFIAFLIGVLAPMICTHLLNKMKFGPYIVGKVGRGKNKKIFKKSA
ncbi:acyltransferase family protein [Bacillus cereus]|uniref:acyltransferase family protein n=1 Tax=Bacillus cereus TaxID=1396 RepID=UPI0032D9E0AB